MRDFTSWGMYIANFVFFVATSLVGMLISSVLGLAGAKWIKPISRIAEIIAVAFAAVAFAVAVVLVAVAFAVVVVLVVVGIVVAVVVAVAVAVAVAVPLPPIQLTNYPHVIHCRLFQQARDSQGPQDIPTRIFAVAMVVVESTVVVVGNIVVVVSMVVVVTKNAVVGVVVVKRGEQEQQLHPRFVRKKRNVH